MGGTDCLFDGSCVAYRAIGPGTLVASRFRLDDLLEDHSGARFWRATDLTLARSVAIHVIEADDPRAPAVLTAARTSATVSDGHILRVLDALQEDGVVHVVHEWGSGVSLDRLLEEDTLEPRRAAWLVREAAEAIAVAHGHGIAHGRLLPENVLLTDAGSVKLIGFVVDAVLHGRPQPNGDAGVPPSEHERDVRNLGALLYACLTGKWPGFPPSLLADAPLDHDRVCRPRQVRPRVPKRLDVLCDQILNDGRPGGRRFESAAEIGSALGDYLGDTLPSADLPVSGPTAFLDPAGLHAPKTTGSLGTYDGVGSPEVAGTSTQETAAAQAADPGTAGQDTEASGSPSSDTGASDTGAWDTEAWGTVGQDAEEHDPEDPEATQAGMPFVDSDPATEPIAQPDRRPRADPSAEPLAESPPQPGRRAEQPTELGVRPVADPALSSDPRTASHWSGSGSAASGMGGGTVPPHWGPDRPDDTDSWSVPPSGGRPGSSWLRLAAGLGVLLLLVLVSVIAFSLGAGRGPDDRAAPEEPSPTPSAKRVQAVEISKVTAFDPDGDGPVTDENPDRVPLSVDGDPSTAWETKTYFDGPVLSPFKSGVGLLVDLGSEIEVADATVTLVGAPYDLQLLAAPAEASAPTSVDGLTTVATVSGGAGDVELAGDRPTTTRYLVVWLTALPEAGGGYRGAVAEVVVRS